MISINTKKIRNNISSMRKTYKIYTKRIRNKYEIGTNLYVQAFSYLISNCFSYLFRICQSFSYFISYCFVFSFVFIAYLFRIDSYTVSYLCFVCFSYCVFLFRMHCVWSFLFRMFFVLFRILHFISYSISYSIRNDTK